MTRPIGILLAGAVLLGVSLGWPGAGIAAVLALAMAMRGEKRDRLLVVVLVTSGILGALRGGSTGSNPVPDAFWQSSGAELTVTGFPRAGSNTTMVRATVDRLRINGQMVESAPVAVWLSSDTNFALAPGARIRVAWTPRSIMDSPPGYARWVRSQGAQALARVWSVSSIAPANRMVRWIVQSQQHVTANLERLLPGDAGALAAGIVTGNDSALSEDAEDAFRRTGTSHITAVSGSNVAIVLAIWYAVVPPGPWRRRFLVRLIIIASIWIYALSVGFEPPAIRAALMATGALAGANAGRRPDPMTLLALASAAIALTFPNSVHQVSYWLSVIASLAIISRVQTERVSSTRTAIVDMSSGVVMAQVCTLPLTLLVFGSWSLTGIVANLILAPLMSLAFPLCFALALVSVAIPPLAPVLAPGAGILLNLSLAVVQSLAKTSPTLAPGAGGPLAIVAIGLPCLLIAAMMSRDVQRWIVRYLPIAD